MIESTFTSISHIVWDWNGTLLDDASACVAALNRMLARRGLSAVDLDAYLEIFDFPVRNYYVKLGFDFEQEDWDGNAREFHAHYDDAVRACALRRGAADLLERWSAAGVPMSVLSASEVGRLEHMLGQWGIRGCFEHVFGLNDVYAASKLEAGRRLMATLDVPSEQVLLIGDTTHDYTVAAALACRCVLLTGGHHAEHRLRRCPCPVLRSLDDLPDPRRAADTAGEPVATGRC